MKGTTPEGARNEEEAARWVRAMFGRVARRYDFANHLLSLQIDRLWRRRVVKLVRPVLRRKGARVMDLCCGTGDLMLALSRDRGEAVMGSDFCHPMLRMAARKGAQSPLVEADALRLPIRDGSLDLITVAFGFRNFVDYQGGLREMRRVMREGGMVAILEFSRPPNPVFRKIYEAYSGRVLPWV
ncbi:MAG: ubiquinone/menaquinone biosynthesis methyltransferase, partial [Acidobacteriota bacterium]|nr:ubiquinone/menaquinone biosynthesis methyltransferase [Acidobacteriota bacterium]